MHPRLRSSLPDPQSQNPRNSAAIPAILLNQIRQTRPKSERLNATVVPLQTLWPAVAVNKSQPDISPHDTEAFC
jgi:hypothetical protein